MESVGEQIPQTVDDILVRWPGVADLNVEQVADLMQYAVRNDLYHVVDAAYNSNSNGLTPAQDAAVSMIRNVHMYIDADDSRETVLMTAGERVFKELQYQAIDAIDSGDREQSEAVVQRLLTSNPFAIRITYGESPLFPEGRKFFAPLDLANGQSTKRPYPSDIVALCHGELDIELDKKVIEYLDNRRNTGSTDAVKRRVRERVESAAVLDEEYHQELRRRYGTKAANLIVFSEAAKRVGFSSDDEGYVRTATIAVPQFTVAPVKLHEFYETEDSRYLDYLEQIRLQALLITHDEDFDPEIYRPLVAVRSSAVESEDGDQVSGAGIYASVTADPRDPDGFRAAVETVFDSVNSEAAIAYRAEHGIDHESMGLLIQKYVEAKLHGSHDKEAFFGYIHSSDARQNLMVLSSNIGELLIDRAKIFNELMFSRTVLDRHKDAKHTPLHTIPDHDSKIAKVSYKSVDLAHAAGFAEKLFGKQVELEFVSEDLSHYVVQVRPMINQPTSESVEVAFPTDIEPLAECRAVGVGDVIVTIRDDGSRPEEGEIKLDVHDTEREASISGMHNTDEEAVMLILSNDGYSGHLQTLARERGQICLFPEPAKRLGNLEEHLWGWNEDRPVRRFRVVADGYKGAIYALDE